MAEESGATSIAARIAALKIDQVGRPPGEPPAYKRNASVAPSEAVSVRPEPRHRPQSTNVPPVTNHGTAIGEIGNQPAEHGMNGHASYVNGAATPTMPNRPVKKAPPALPPRKPSGPAPQLPPRRPSEMSLELPSRSDYGMSRRTSTDSTASAMSSKSSLSRVSTKTGTSISSAGPLYSIKAPEFDASKLPPLPKREKESQAPRAALKANKSSPSVLPPALPGRSPSLQDVPSTTSELAERTSSPQNVALRSNQPVKPKQSILTLGFNNGAAISPPVIPKQPASVHSAEHASAAHNNPPPIPLASRPDLTKLMASKPKLNGKNVSSQSQDSCLICRDFSAVDAHAARFPRDAIPSTDVGWLANQLSAPFPSATDKARAIFTWLHHNVAYDTVAFFGNCVKPSTPSGTIASGLAVCEGYAGLFTALAIKAGLESVVAGGHGKGFGYDQPAPGAPLPPYQAGHAWNAVKIDNDQWKLIDPCWGAGCLMGDGKDYHKRFEPAEFTADNNDFGLRHYPGDDRYFYRTDGRATISWEEYILGPNNGVPGPQIFDQGKEGISSRSFLPSTKQISVRDSQPYIRFQFGKVCPHWDIERNGAGKHYLYILLIGGVDGRSPRNVPFQTDHTWWWLDMPPRELGAPGGQVKIAQVTQRNGLDGRGLTAAKFEEKVSGATSMAFNFVAIFDLV